MEREVPLPGGAALQINTETITDFNMTLHVRRNPKPATYRPRAARVLPNQHQNLRIYHLSEAATNN